MSKSTAPERIFATMNGMSTSLPGMRRSWVGGWSEDSEMERGTEYVRADIARARIAALEAALEQIGVYGCGMLNQPAAMNGPEEAWLRKRIARYEQVARDALLEPQS